MLHCIFVFLSQTINLCIDVALCAPHSAFEVNSATVPYVCALQACCRSAGCVYTPPGTWRQSTGRMFVWNAHSRAPLPSIPTPSSSPGALDLSSQAERSRWVRVCVCLYVHVRKWDKTSNLPHCVREHPPPQPTEREVGESSGSLQTVQDSLCMFMCVCAHIEHREKKQQQVWFYVLSCLCENKIASFPRLSLVWLSICDSPTNQTHYCSTKSTHSLLGVLLPAATLSSCRRHF